MTYIKSVFNKIIKEDSIIQTSLSKNSMSKYIEYRQRKFSRKKKTRKGSNGYRLGPITLSTVYCHVCSRHVLVYVLTLPEPL